MNKIIMFFTLFLISCSSQESIVCFDDACFNVELAVTSEERSTGLMYRESLPDSKGMLFIYGKEGIYPFWMKNTKIPLDIIWISNESKVVHISENTPICEVNPCPVYNPNVPAQYVLEINSGLADKYDVEIGNDADMKIR